jgi:hypothetical protein
MPWEIKLQIEIINSSLWLKYFAAFSFLLLVLEEGTYWTYHNFPTVERIIIITLQLVFDTRWTVC